MMKQIKKAFIVIGVVFGIALSTPLIAGDNGKGHGADKVKSGWEHSMERRSEMGRKHQHASEHRMKGHHKDMEEKKGKKEKKDKKDKKDKDKEDKHEHASDDDGDNGDHEEHSSHDDDEDQEEMEHEEDDVEENGSDD